MAIRSGWTINDFSGRKRIIFAAEDAIAISFGGQHASKRATNLAVKSPSAPARTPSPLPARARTTIALSTGSHLFRALARPAFRPLSVQLIGLAFKSQRIDDGKTLKRVAQNSEIKWLFNEPVNS